MTGLLVQFEFQRLHRHASCLCCKASADGRSLEQG